ncbi:MAG: hypothetical protein KDJ19_06955 [Hyphomicrobiaceae bacterium]|nr:hypothetical protein [Hyphomicrobiaceae bacterium]MCC0023675.1 hypothetical protein [Hyphomicrobiaceae bacterium]
MFIPPLLILPLIIYNLVAFDLVGSREMGWAQPVFSFSMPSGAVWSMNVADLLVVFALVLLLIDVIRSRHIVRKMMNLGASLLVLAIYVGEFVLVPAAATSVFFACLVMSGVDAITKLLTPARPGPVHLPRFDD